MKKIANRVFNPCRYLVLPVCLLFCVSASLSAQEGREKSVAPGSGGSASSWTWSANDHWFLGAGIGPRIYFGDHNRQMKLVDRPSLGGELYVGKWWSPIIGTRVGFSLQTVNGLTLGAGGGHRVDEMYKDPNLWRQKFGIGHAYGDLLLNLTNLLAGEDPNRFYTISPYVGVGWMRTWDDPQDSEVSANIGVFNTFRLNDTWDFTLDVRGTAVDDRFDGDVGGRTKEGLLSLSLGFVYNFGGRSWNTPKDALSVAEVDFLNNRIVTIAGENAQLRDQLSQVEAQTPIRTTVEKVTEWRDVAVDVLILFPLNQSVLTKDARVQLGFLAELMKKYPGSTYTITGYADEGTGSSDRNIKLSKDRADAIKLCLTREFGVTASRLATVAAGGIENRYYNDPALSRSAVIRPNK
jgi:outer membrane protein OmpA-like peptidoglycan-associated protein